MARNLKKRFTIREKFFCYSLVYLLPRSPTSLRSPLNVQTSSLLLWLAQQYRVTARILSTHKRRPIPSLRTIDIRNKLQRLILGRGDGRWPMYDEVQIRRILLSSGYQKAELDNLESFVDKQNGFVSLI